MMQCTLTAAQRQTYRRYAALALPRHTSYPIASMWTPAYDPSAFRTDLERLRTQPQPLSLYVHVPFCARLCYYCACTKEIVPDQHRRVSDPSDAFLAGLASEASRMAAIVKNCPIQEIHLGGGSPTFLRPPQLERLWHVLTTNFRLAPDAACAVEIDPRITSRAQLETLRRLGCNRISLGIQDFNPEVQRAVNRIQPVELVERVVGWCRALGFASINFDLIYGLPFQTLATMAATLKQTLALAPDRIAFYRLAVIPEMFRWQNTFRHADLPSGDLSLDLNLLTIATFTAAGYEFIGLDHFARPQEALATAYRQHSLCRNFQGMAAGKGLALLGLGPSAISQLDGAFAQNQKTTETWHAALAKDLATVQGMRLSRDDQIRQALLQELYGYGSVEKPAFEAEFGITFDAYFADELVRLQALAADGLVALEPQRIGLNGLLGRLLVRVVAAVFDRYLPPEAFRCGLEAHRASKVG